jgi:hypothetical protein
MNSHILRVLGIAVLSEIAVVLFGPSIAGAQGLTIVQPVPDASVTPNQQITVAIETSEGFSPVSFLVTAPEVAVEVAAPATSTSITIPSTVTGPYTVGVVAKDTSNQFKSAQVTIQIIPTVGPTSIVVTQPAIEVGALDPSVTQLTVIGAFPDGNFADITALPSTTYQSSNTAVAGVGATGNVLAISRGTATITVSNGAQSASVSVNVTSDPNALFAAVLPASRSVVVGNVASAFASMIYQGTVLRGGTVAKACVIEPFGTVPASFVFQQTDLQTNQPIGNPNEPVDIPIRQRRSFVFGFVPNEAFNPVDVPLLFRCSNTTPAAIIVGLNTLLVSASQTPVPDLIAIGDTLSHDGIVNIPGTTGIGLFVTAAINIGAAATITATVDDGGRSLPLSLSICQTNSGTGQCINPATPSLAATVSVGQNQTVTFSVFASGTGSVPFDPANNRLFLRLKDAGGITRGATNVAVRTQ